MRLLVLLALALVPAGCGVAAETGSPGSSGEKTLAAEPDKPIPTLDESELRPPPIVLVSQAGKQIAAQGSSCVQFVDPDSGQGSGACSDVGGPLLPERVSIVQRGDTATLVVGGASAQDGKVTVRPLGCTDEETLAFDLAAGMSGTPRQIELDPGAYQLDVFTRFESNDGRSGDLSGSLGLLVAESDARAIVPVKPADAVCPFGA
jgi:hypothetical protein